PGGRDRAAESPWRRRPDRQALRPDDPRRDGARVRRSMTEFEARMAVLRERFRDRAAAAREQIRTALASRDYEALERMSHSLSGTAGIFGHPKLGLAAEQVEIGIEENISADALEARCRA